MARCPFVNLPNGTGRRHWGEGITAEDMTTLRWVTPAIVVQVAFVEWTRDSLLRQPRHTNETRRIVRRTSTATGSIRLTGRTRSIPRQWKDRAIGLIPNIASSR
jgi:hypothetical protein